MQVELKDITVCPTLSQETTAFSAELWLDGKKAADCHNDGNGGSNMLYFADQAMVQAFDKFCRSQPPEVTSYGAPLAMDGDLYISLLLEKHQHEKWLAAKMKKAVLYRLVEDKSDVYRTMVVNKANRKSVVDHLKKKHGARLVEVH